MQVAQIDDEVIVFVCIFSQNSPSLPWLQTHPVTPGPHSPELLHVTPLRSQRTKLM